MYRIILQDLPANVPERLRLDAQRRFQRTLERALGGPEAVLSAYRAWQAAQENVLEEMRESDIEQAKRWAQATTRAQQEGFRDLGECEAWFELRAE